MAQEREVADENNLVTLAEMATNNVLDQLELDKLQPEHIEEIKMIMRNEIRRVEIELSVMIMDMRNLFAADIEALKTAGKLPDDHFLNVVRETANAG